MVKFHGVNMRHIVEHLFENELSELGEYISTIEGALKRKFDEFDDYVDRQTAGMTEDQKAEYVEWFSDDAWRLADRFPLMVRKTSFVFLYGLFEHTLINLCGHVKRYGKFKEKVTDGKNKGITAVQKYLKGVAHVKFPDQSKEWNEIKMMAEIRNLYSHRQGRLKDDSEALRAYIKGSKGMIELTGLDEIKLNAGYCEHAIGVIRKFFAAMMKEIPANLLRQTVEEDIAETVEAMKGLRSKRT